MRILLPESLIPVYLKATGANRPFVTEDGARRRIAERFLRPVSYGPPSRLEGVRVKRRLPDPNGWPVYDVEPSAPAGHRLYRSLLSSTSTAGVGSTRSLPSIGHSSPVSLVRRTSASSSRSTHFCPSAPPVRSATVSLNSFESNSTPIIRCGWPETPPAVRFRCLRPCGFVTRE